jgi:ABC-2 type transport system ATP-binding protein
MISINNLTYDYADKRALHEVSFEIKEGAITALVGPNGSGKTTLLRSIAALAKPLTGDIVINGYNALTHPQEVHLQVGYLQDLFGLYDELTVIQSLQFTAYSRLKPEADMDEAVEVAIRRAGVDTFTDKKVSALSRGMRQRVGIAQAIIHQPKVLLLDEPASGLDPEARHSLSNLLIELRNVGMTIIVSSHILAELEDYSTEMLVLQDGKIIQHNFLKEQISTNNFVSIEIGCTEPAEHYSGSISSISGVKELIVSDRKIHLKADLQVLSKQSLLKQLINMNIPVEQFAEVKVNLQDEYIKTLSNYKQTKAE